MTPEQRKEIEEALAKATPGSWGLIGLRIYTAESRRYAEDEICVAHILPDAHLIANTPEWLRQLLDENQRQNGEIESLRIERIRLEKENQALKREIESHGQEDRNYTNQQYVSLLQENQAQAREIKRLERWNIVKSAANEELAKENARYREALEWYAETFKNYNEGIRALQAIGVEKT